MIYIYILNIHIIYIYIFIYLLRDHLAHIPPGIHLKPAGRCRAFSRRSRRVPTDGAQAINMPNRGLSWFMNIMTWVYHGLWTLWLGFIMVYEHYDLGLWWFMNIMTWVYDGLRTLWLGFMMVYEHYDLGLWWFMNIMIWVSDGLWTLWFGSMMVYEHYEYFLGIPLFWGLQHYDFNHAALELTSLMGCRGHGSKSMDPHLLWLNTWNILKLLSVWV